MSQEIITEERSKDVNDKDCRTEVSGQSRKQKLADFIQYEILHPNLENTLLEARRAINGSPLGSLLSISGPSGVGKTTLMRFLEKILGKEFEGKAKDDCEIVPYVSVEARSPENGNFKWTGYYRTILHYFNEPGIDQKVDSSKWRLLPAGVYSMVTGSKSPSIEKLRESVEQVFSRRRPEVVMIDEAQHFGKLCSGRKLNDQQDTIKSIANTTGITHVLFGTYEILSMRNLSGQLARRTVDIEFPRYKNDNVDDIKAFRSVLYSFQNKLPLEAEFKFTDEWRYFYEYSIGCVGILKTWLNQALSRALDENCEKFKMEHLCKSALPSVKVLRLLDEALEGENTFKGEQNKDEESLSSKLWTNNPFATSVITVREEEPPKAAPSKKPKNMPGTRNPKRDAVGAGRRCA